jgi:hypothetical protein
MHEYVNAILVSFWVHLALLSETMLNVLGVYSFPDAQSLVSASTVSFIPAYRSALATKSPY